MSADALRLDRSRNDVRMDGVFFRRVSAAGPFAKALEPGGYSYCVMVRSGWLRLETDFPVAMEVELGAGDAVAVSGLAPHLFRTPGAPRTAAVGRFERRPLTGGGPPAEVELVLGVAPNEALALGSLMLGPIIVRPSEHPDLSRRLWRAVEMLEDEYADASWIDRDLVIRRLAEIMLVNMSRRVFADRAGAGRSPREPASRQLIAAINAFFAAPERAWTLAGLARAAGMSRTRFAEEFKLVTGQTPGRIISRMRLTAIAGRLASEPLSVEAAAEHAGYSSSAAFVRAFQREFGETPARWRRRRGDAESRRKPLRPRRPTPRPALSPH
jgi:AraC-like DNA-binding protein